LKQEKVYETSWSEGRARKRLINYPGKERKKVEQIFTEMEICTVEDVE
jgi:hypothetical protein